VLRILRHVYTRTYSVYKQHKEELHYFLLTDLNIPTIQSTCEKRYVMQHAIQRGRNDTKGTISRRRKTEYTVIVERLSLF